VNIGWQPQFEEKKEAAVICNIKRRSGIQAFKRSRERKGGISQE